MFSLSFVPFLPDWRRPLSAFPFALLTTQTAEALRSSEEELATAFEGCVAALMKAYSGSMWVSTPSLAKPWRERIIYCSILSFSEPPKMNPVVEPLSWMLGTWLSDPPGVGTFPTLQPFQYLEEVHISHVGQPMLNFS